MPLDYIKALWQNNNKDEYSILFIKLNKKFKITTKSVAIFNI